MGLHMGDGTAVDRGTLPSSDGAAVGQETLHLSDGTPVDQPTFIELQEGLMHSWSPRKGLPPDDLLKQNDLTCAWILLFAVRVRELCQRLDVSVDVMERAIAGIQEQIRQDLELLKWLQSEVQHHNVGWAGAAALIRSELSEVRDHTGRLIGWNLSLAFPYVDPSGNGANGHPPVLREELLTLNSVA